MSRKPGKVEFFRNTGKREELARLERLTGLQFESVPESLLRQEAPAGAVEGERTAGTALTPRSRPARS